MTTSTTLATSTALATNLDSRPRTRRISGFKPTGSMHLGNYLGAIRPMISEQSSTDSLVFLADLHALTLEHRPADVHAATLENATLLLAAGVDPDRATLYVQSHVPETRELHYLLECATAYGEAHRMIQFKEKAADRPHVRLSLLTYPVLMAADILQHDIHDVPVGDDQSQHVELTRDVATRFNARYGDTFVVPKAVNPKFAARLQDLADPSAKMGKSAAVQSGVIRLLDPPDAVARKVRRAVTDLDGDVRYDPVGKPGVANLLAILAACTGTADPTQLRLDSYADLKAAVTDAVITTLAPIQVRYAELAKDPRRLRAVLRSGAERARVRAAATVRRASDAIGLLAP
ncbi:MAG TPA: tryptophan--tRNA ligase [Micromonosporaceae bacterium]|nr:tryptophan--tRNA ligase [Micromonosporaceae bacterium]